MHRASKIFCRLLLTVSCLALLSCASISSQKNLDYKKLTPTNTDKTIHYSVYTPPGWQASEQLPLLVFLHGAGSTHRSFERFGANKYFDEQITKGLMPRVVLVSPKGGFGFWENWADGSHNYRDWVINDILPKVQKDYNTLNCPTHCHVMGLSMGGFGALRFGYLSDNTFSSVSAISAPIIGKEEKSQTNNSFLLKLLFPLDRIFGKDFSKNYVNNSIEKAWINNRALDDIRLQIIVGDDDFKQMIKNNQRFHEGLTANNRDHDYIIYNGKHKWKSWIPNFAQAVNFLVDEQYKTDPQ